VQIFDEFFLKRRKKEKKIVPIFFWIFLPNFGFKKKCSQHLESDFNLTTYVKFDLNWQKDL
jgi:hypothetical protein